MSKTKLACGALVGLLIAVACAEEDNAANFSDGGGGERAGSGGAAGSGAKAGGSGGGASPLPNGGSGGSASAGRGGSGGATNQAGTANAGSTSGGTTGSAGTGNAGSGGSAPVPLGCLVEGGGGEGGAAGGATGDGGGASLAGAPAEGGAGGQEAAGGQGGLATAGGEAGAGGVGPLPPLLLADFESGVATGWVTTLGSWAVVDDSAPVSKVYEQSLQENKLQIAIADGSCFADQVIEARVKVLDFKGQSNSYVAALFGRVLSAQTHYLFALGSDGKIILRKRVNGTSTSATAIGSAVNLTITEGVWYDVRFEIIGTTLRGCVGGTCVTGTDAAIASGGVGLGTVNTSARFDDVRVTAP